MAPFDLFPFFPADDMPLCLPDALLRPGDHDHDVKLLQRALRNAGYQLEIDGRFGRITLECVRSFQSSHGLTRDGLVGPDTWDALQCCEPAA